MNDIIWSSVEKIRKNSRKSGKIRAFPVLNRGMS